MRRVAVLMVAATGAIGAMGATACSGFLNSDVKAPQERIAFACDNGPTRQLDICTMHPDGSGRSVLLGSTAVEDSPVWSRDGTKIAFSSTPSGGDPTVWVAFSDGVGTAMANTPTPAQYPEWSPDGHTITYSWSGLYVMALNGVGGATKIVDDSMAVDRSSWSPLQSQIVVGTTKGIFLVKSDGTGLLQLTTSATDHMPAFSADGSHIAFAASDSGIDVMNADGSNRVRILHDSLATSPAWSPYGDSIAYVVTTTPKQIWIMSSTGTNAHPLDTGAASASSPTWAFIQ